jgi:hypothetical protein
MVFFLSSRKRFCCVYDTMKYFTRQQECGNYRVWDRKIIIETPNGSAVRRFDSGFQLSAEKSCRCLDQLGFHFRADNLTFVFHISNGDDTSDHIAFCENGHGTRDEMCFIVLGEGILFIGMSGAGVKTARFDDMLKLGGVFTFQKLFFGNSSAGDDAILVSDSDGDIAGLIECFRIACGKFHQISDG